ncbi:MAG: hypothetical protein H6573_11605 [Lewinellaceae bacterium]|nr:hypothetical protein [Lewinellaceae bacterium]
MKKRLLFAMLLAAIAGMGLASCNDQPQKKIGQEPTFNEDQPAQLVANKGRKKKEHAISPADARALTIANLQTAFAGETTVPAPNTPLTPKSRSRSRPKDRPAV